MESMLPYQTARTFTVDRQRSLFLILCSNGVSMRDNFCFRGCRALVEGAKRKFLQTLRVFQRVKRWDVTLSFALVAYPIALRLPVWDDDRNNAARTSILNRLIASINLSLRRRGANLTQSETLKVVRFILNFGIEGCAQVIMSMSCSDKQAIKTEAFSIVQQELGSTTSVSRLEVLVRVARILIPTLSEDLLPLYKHVEDFSSTYNDLLIVFKKWHTLCAAVRATIAPESSIRELYHLSTNSWREGLATEAEALRKLCLYCIHHQPELVFAAARHYMLLLLGRMVDLMNTNAVARDDLVDVDVESVFGELMLWCPFARVSSGETSCAAARQPLLRGTTINPIGPEKFEELLEEMSGIIEQHCSASLKTASSKMEMKTGPVQFLNSDLTTFFKFDPTTANTPYDDYLPSYSLFHIVTLPHLLRPPPFGA